MEKVRLRNTILKSLNHLYFDASFEQKLREDIQEASLLISKGFYTTARKVLKKLKIQSYELGFNAEILSIVQLEKNIQVNIPDTHLYLEQLINEEFDVVERMKRHIEWKNHMNKAHSLYYQLYFDKPDPALLAEFDALMRSELIVHPHQSASFRELAISNSVHGLYHMVYKNYKGTFAYNWKNYLLYKAHPAQIKVFPRGYANALNDVANSATLTHDTKTAQFIFKTLRALYKSETSLNIQAHILSILYMQELHHYIYTGQFETALKLGLEIELQMDSMKEEDMVIPDKALIYDNLVTIFIIHGMIKKALKWTYRLLEENTSNIKDVNVRARLYQLILYYEMNNIDDIDYLLRQKYYKTPSKYRVEQVFVSFFKNIVKGRVDENEALAHLTEELRPLRNQVPEDHLFENLDLLAWVECKRSGLSLIQVLNRGN